ncbi:Aste57867_14488 [Aphanomyces stellatus]|uniref:Aste57867_14488 protein n=1 Tax=Aphanomyces stellatus TaxID=120398 RepID=A0A485L1C9_9STRA|nr:hypothetical protein As57867_014434 [Aphanomyces stellatus]VFT91310.1 Aste57867_14488 [Aphanomyces stellatus]
MTDAAPSPYTLTEGSFQSSRGIQIYTRKYIPTDPYNTVLLFLHGVGEHCSRFHSTFETFAAHHIAVYAMDHRGHGRSGGKRHDCACFDEFTDDIAAFTKILRADHSSQPSMRYVVSGISFGGLLAASTAAAAPANHWDGLMLFAPAIGIEMTPTLKIQQAFAPILGFIAPTWQVVPAVDTNLLSRNEAFLEAYRTDPLNDHSLLRVRLALSIKNGMDVLDRTRGNIKMPVLIFHGEADKVTSPTISKAFYDALATEKEYKSLPGQFHCLLDEPERDETIRAAIEWTRGPKSSNPTSC